MKKRMTAVLVLAALLLTLFTACGSKKSSVLTAEEAQKIALESAGFSADQVSDVHTHVGNFQEQPCFSIHITVDGTEYEYVIAALTGEILASGIVTE